VCALRGPDGGTAGEEMGLPDALGTTNDKQEGRQESKHRRVDNVPHTVVSSIPYNPARAQHKGAR
jgi:hypothetical protein